MSFKKKNYLLLWFTCAFQLFILLGMVIWALIPLINGRPVVLPIQATDPRDLMRGNYVALRYSFSNISTHDILNDLDYRKRYRYGDILWLALEPQGEIFKPVGLYAKKPEAGMFIRVMVQNSHVYEDSLGKKNLFFSLRAGIEDYFTTPQRAQLLETQMQKNDSLQPLAFVKVAPNGVARLEKIELRKVKKES